jgi:parvulin-like peptidyl-prolyl isomerase
MVPSHTPTVASAPNTSFPAPTGTTVASGPELTNLQATGKAVVKVNGTVLTDRDLLREMLAMFPYAKLHNGFPKKQEAGIRKGAMQMIVFEELVYQEALRRKMTIAPARITSEEKKFQQQFSNREQFNEYLKEEQGGSEARLREQIKRSLLIDAMLKNEVDNKSVVTLAEARAYYEKNPREFEHGETFNFQTISILPPANASPQTLQETRKRAEDVLKQAKATKNYGEFGLLAEKVSEDDYRVNMGDRKAVTAENVPPEVAAALRKMKPGEVSGLLQLGTAYTILHLNAHTPPGKAKFAEVKGQLMEKLHKQKFENLRAGLGKRLRSNAKIEEL